MLTRFPYLGLGGLLLTIMVALTLFEWARGRLAEGRKTTNDWKMFGLSLGSIALLERPILLAAVYGIGRLLVPDGAGTLAWLESTPGRLAALVFAYVALDELLNGLVHKLAHSRAPKSFLLAKIHAFYAEAHRPHHLHGDDTDRGELTASHSIVAGWGWFLFGPNYWMGALALYLGLFETWFLGSLIKNLWGLHVHTNWSYDLYLLNHPNRFVRGAMRGACHVLTFPNQHHQHHSRSKNATKNLQNIFAIYDWLLWGTLVIETERPKVYGYRQKKDEKAALKRFLRRPLKVRAR